VSRSFDFEDPWFRAVYSVQDSKLEDLQNIENIHTFLLSLQCIYIYNILKLYNVFYLYGYI